MTARLLRSGHFALHLLLAAALAAGCSKKEDKLLEPPDSDAGIGTIGTDAGPGTGGDTDAGSAPVTPLEVTRVAPGNGPFSGGNRVIVRGAGFAADAIVTFDGRRVQPADTDLLDESRLSVVVPAGDVGPADVAVMQGDAMAVATGAYTYDAIHVDPASGSVAGGTFVTVTGSGTAFTDGEQVFFGRSRCSDVTIVSPTVITCRTPPLAAGTVDVTVRRAADMAETVARQAYTYFDTSDPLSGGLGGGEISGTINLTVLNAMTGEPVEGAFAFVGDELTTAYQGLTDAAGQIAFSGPDLSGRQVITAAKFCFERTTFVSFNARDVTMFLTPWMDPMCGMGGGGGGGRPRNGSFVEGELIWRGPAEFGPNPWANIPTPRANEVKVAYVYATRPSVNVENPDPASGGAHQRVLEDTTGARGYPYKIFVRPGGMAVYALAGLENTATGEFVPYVMGVGRNVLVGPAATASNVDMVMDIPLDHTFDVRLDRLPHAARSGPDRLKVSANVDLGGEGVIVREVNMTLIDEVRQRRNDRPFRFTSQPALLGALSDGRYRIQAGWYTGDFDAQPYTIVVRNGVGDVASGVTIDDFLGIPQATSPAYGDRLPADRTLRWSHDGPDPDFYIVLVIGGDGNPAWRHYVPGNVHEAPVPDLSSIGDLGDIASGTITWAVYAVRSPGFHFDDFRYTDLSDAYWSAWSLDVYVAQR